MNRDRTFTKISMILQIAFFSAAIFLLLALALAAPAEQKPVETFKAEEKDDLATADKDDLKTAASHWGGHWGGYGGHYGGHYGYYPSYGYGYGWGWPSYGYGYWPYGGYYGHHGYGGWW